MNAVQTIVVFSSFAIVAQTLTCWTCENAESNSGCMRTGRAQICQKNEQACQNEVRRGSYGMLITKRCKQALACDNNFIQNPRQAWSPSQCNSRVPSSVCRCCCDTDLCNRKYLNCSNAIISDVNVRDPGNRNNNCTSVPEPQNGRKICHLGNNVISARGSVEIGTECKFLCNEDFELVGSPQIACAFNQQTRRATFNGSTPSCIKPTCKPLRAPASGSISCTNQNISGSVCSFICDESRSYSLFPTNITQSVCRSNGSWNRPIPCSARNCPPFAVMDLALVLDSSSSIGQKNWETMKKFVRDFIKLFDYSNEFSRLSVIRFNAEIDSKNQILFNSFIGNEIGLLAAFDQIPYNGKGTKTGQALQYARDVLFTKASGDRSDVSDIVIVFTDGKAPDDGLLREAANDLRTLGVTSYAVGFGKNVDIDQLNIIAGSENVFLALEDIAQLEGLLKNQIKEEVCENRCSKQ